MFDILNDSTKTLGMKLNGMAQGIEMGRGTHIISPDPGLRGWIQESKHSLIDLLEERS